MSESSLTRDQLLAAGYVAERRSLFDEEGVEGWEWYDPQGESLGTVVGVWDEPPPLPEIV